MSSYESDK